MHLLWVVIVVPLVVVGVAYFVFISRGSVNPSQLAARKQYSADGQWWWDGRQWQPVTQPTPPTPPQQPPPGSS